MDYMVFDGFPELLNANCLLPSFKFNHADGPFLHEMHLLIRSETINLPLPLIGNAVRISDTQSGGFSFSIG
jgi:hypothetical protein